MTCLRAEKVPSGMSVAYPKSNIGKLKIKNPPSLSKEFVQGVGVSYLMGFCRIPSNPIKIPLKSHDSQAAVYSAAATAGHTPSVVRPGPGPCAAPAAPARQWRPGARSWAKRSWLTQWLCYVCYVDGVYWCLVIWLKGVEGSWLNNIQIYYMNLYDIHTDHY